MRVVCGMSLMTRGGGLVWPAAGTRVCACKVAAPPSRAARPVIHVFRNIPHILLDSAKVRAAASRPGEGRFATARGFSKMLKRIGSTQMAASQGLTSFSWKSDADNDKKDWALCEM